MKDEQPVNSQERLRKARDQSWKDRGNGRLPDTELRLEDFYAYMPQHRYIFAATRELWPAASVNARLPLIGDIKPARMAGSEPAGRADDLVSWRADADPRQADRRGRLDRAAGFDRLQPLPAATLPARDPGKANPWLDHVRQDLSRPC